MLQTDDREDCTIDGSTLLGSHTFGQRIFNLSLVQDPVSWRLLFLSVLVFNLSVCRQKTLRPRTLKSRASTAGMKKLKT